MITSGWSDPKTRDDAFTRMKQDGERDVTKFSTVEMIVNQATGEISLDSQDRIQYHSVYCLAYPSTVPPIRIRNRVRKTRRGDGWSKLKITDDLRFYLNGYLKKGVSI